MPSSLNLGTLTSWNPLGQSRPLKGLFTFTFFQISTEWKQFSCPTFLQSDWNLNNKQDREVCLSILSIIRPECIPNPTTEQWKLTTLDFETRANFPHCFGAIGGKHIRIIKTEHSGSMFYNYKAFFFRDINGRGRY